MGLLEEKGFFPVNFFKAGGSVKSFHVGQRVKWNSEAGWVQGTIISVHKQPFNLSGKDGKKYKRHASKDNPVYGIKSSKTDHIAYHYGRALTKI